MKKIPAFLLALMLLFSAVFTGADVLTDGFDPDAVAKGMQAKVNEKLSEPIAVIAADTPGLYTVFYRNTEMSCYLSVTHAGEEGTAENRIEFSESVIYAPDTLQMYLEFWLVCSAGLMQYVTGEADFDRCTDTLFRALQDAMAASDKTARFSSGGFDVEVSLLGGSGMLLLGLGITVRDLY